MAPEPPRQGLPKSVRLALAGAGAVALLVVGLWAGMGLRGEGKAPASGAPADFASGGQPPKALA